MGSEYSYTYVVENPSRPVFFLKNSKLYVCGWFFDAEGKAAKQIKIQTKKDVFLCQPRERMDIKKKYEEIGFYIDSKCGFDCFCDLSRGIKWVKIYALVLSGQWVKLADFVIIVHKKKSSTDQSVNVVHKPKAYSQPADKNVEWLRAALELFIENNRTSLLFPTFADPTLSIVISTRNRAELLYQCLQSILAHVSIPYELIIADNSSTDSTPLLLKKIQGIKTFRNEKDLEYLQSVNKAASLARAKYLLLLNNDIILSPQSIDHLLKTMEAYPRCGAVGCKLVRPDGTLQEAGSIIWADGSALAYGRNDPQPMRPEYSFIREVDYCSAACLLIRRDLWERLGGYDPRYVPAYYEDSDLCLGLWSLGYKVVYQPASVVFHYEFGSRPVETAMAMMAKNKEKFFEKWKDWLKTHHRADFDVLKARDRRDQPLVPVKDKERLEGFKGRILFLDDRIPHPRLGRGYGRSFSILQILERSGYFLTFYPLISQEDYPIKNEQLSFMEKIELMVGWGPEKLEIFLQERQGYYDFLFVSRIYNFKTLTTIIQKRPELFVQSRIIYDAEAIFAKREILKNALYGINQTEEEKSKLLQEEVSFGRFAHRILAVSSKEAQYFEEKGYKVHLLGHTLECHLSEKGFKERTGFLFVGYMGEKGPNTDGLAWFKGYVLPVLKQKMQEKLEVFAVGETAEDFVEQIGLSEIKFLGHLEDIRPFYEQCRVFIAPTRYAAGIPMKVHEAASYGVPVVTTSLIAEQLSWNHGEELLVADSPEDFAECCLKLHSDETLWESIREQAFNRVKKDCDPKRFEENLLSALDFS
ncbi:glycosyltransferase [Methylacidiphilum caldifontis]|nr:glycosyltransferase [Methylacidiphilum caldifontis]